MRPLFTLFLLLSMFSFSSIYAQENVESYKSIVKKGNIHLVTSFLIVNDMSWRVINDEDDDPGILGITTGINYCYTDNRFLSFQVGIANHTPYGEVIGTDRDGWHKTYRGASQFMNFRNNHVWRRFDFGYGLSLSNLHYSYVHHNYDLDIYKAESYTSVGLGASFSAYCRMATIFYLGVLYQPQLISLSGGPLVDYKHTISLEVVFRANVGKTRMIKKG